MSKPTLDEVVRYGHDRQFTYDPVRFFKYYNDRNWIANGHPIVNWKGLYDRTEENYKKEHANDRPEYLSKPIPDDDDITPEERAELIADIERLKAEVQRQIDEYQMSKKGTHYDTE